MVSLASCRHRSSAFSRARVCIVQTSLSGHAASSWALWQQNFSSWIVQAESMDRHLFGVEWLSSQIQTVNPIFILIMLPLFSYWLYPAVEKVVRLTPLRKIGAGLFVTAGSFFLV